MKSKEAKRFIDDLSITIEADGNKVISQSTVVGIWGVYMAINIAEQEAEERMRKELTRWNDPNKPPTDEMRVIAKVVLPNGATFVTGAWYAVNEFPTGWSVDLDRTFENLHVLGWRPIYENE